MNVTFSVTNSNTRPALFLFFSRTPQPSCPFLNSSTQPNNSHLLLLPLPDAYPPSQCSTLILGLQLPIAYLLTSFEFTQALFIETLNSKPMRQPHRHLSHHITCTYHHHQVTLNSSCNRGVQSKMAWEGCLASLTRNTYLQFHEWGGEFCGSHSH